MAQFSDKEIALIKSGDETTPMRVLLTTNEEDSLILRKKCSDIDITKNKEELQLLIERMKVTIEVESGVGLAAPQVGILRNIFLFTKIDQPGYPIIAAINPRIINHPDETVCFEKDGCLSIPGASGNSIRYPWVEVEYIDEQGKIVKEKLEGYSRAGNFTGIVFQHEYDHLEGILFTDKLCKIIDSQNPIE